MPIVKHLNNFFHFIKKKNIQGEQLILQSQGAGEFDLAVSFYSYISSGFIYLGTALPADSRVFILRMWCGWSSSGHASTAIVS